MYLLFSIPCCFLFLIGWNIYCNSKGKKSSQITDLCILYSAATVVAAALFLGANHYFEMQWVENPLLFIRKHLSFHLLLPATVAVIGWSTTQRADHQQENES
ncbi:MAG: hypothetical protein KDK71_07185 [Chlamydiia bacterium]|nr:hypothetical protein [Chlamydiia bacterium]